MAETNINTQKICKRCAGLKSITEFNKDKNRSDGRFPYCKVCTRAESKKQYSSDIEKGRAQRKADYEKNKTAYKERAARWANENPETRREARLTYDRANREKKSADGKRHRELNPGYYRAHFKKRQQLKRKAMPQWADEAAIRAIYEECARRSKETGVKHHVDHYYPLQNELVCGLHCEYNLRIITAFENLSKGNSFPSEEL